jgi:hypothetical protein
MLPVDPERLRREFPTLSDQDLDAYVTVTTQVMGAGKDRPQLMRDILEGARAARERRQQGQALKDQEQLWVRYLDAVEKMQASTARRS